MKENWEYEENYENVCGWHDQPNCGSMATRNMTFSLSRRWWHIMTHSQDHHRSQMCMFRQLNICVSKNTQAESRQQENWFTRQTSATAFHNLCFDDHEISAKRRKIKKNEETWRKMNEIKKDEKWRKWWKRIIMRKKCTKKWRKWKWGKIKRMRNDEKWRDEKCRKMKKIKETLKNEGRLRTNAKSLKISKVLS